MTDARRQLRQKIVDGTYYVVTAPAAEIKKLLSTIDIISKQWVNEEEIDTNIEQVYIQYIYFWDKELERRMKDSNVPYCPEGIC